ncbi:MAG: SRPBCC family protein [Actinobacteria bacterium]|nr:SRPBCC family protein [Actinomycetota bacterium]
MDVEASALVKAPVPVVLGVLQDLSTYPSWLSIVASAVALPPRPVDEGPAWLIELVARVGPLSRRKRVRMVRTLHDPLVGEVRFERREDDGRDHSAWVLTGRATREEPSQDGGAGTRLTVRIHYGGASRLPGIDILLRQEARRAGERLEALLQRRGQDARGT